MLEYDLDDLIKVREIIKKYFPENKVILEIYNSPEDGELETVINIEVPVGYGVEKTLMTLDKFDEEMFNNKDLEESLGSICVEAKFV